jgi:hypothetical protein
LDGNQRPLFIGAANAPETKVANLTLVLQIYSYLAFTAARYPQASSRSPA